MNNWKTLLVYLYYTAELLNTVKLLSSDITDKDMLQLKRMMSSGIPNIAAQAISNSSIQLHLVNSNNIELYMSYICASFL